MKELSVPAHRPDPASDAGLPLRLRLLNLRCQFNRRLALAFNSWMFVRRYESLSERLQSLYRLHLESTRRIEQLSQPSVDDRLAQMRAVQEAYDRRLYSKKGERAFVYVYFAQSTVTGLIKISSTSHLEKRINNMEWKLGESLRVLGVIVSQRGLERKLHRRFKTFRATHPREPTSKKWYQPASVIMNYVQWKQENV